MFYDIFFNFLERMEFILKFILAKIIINITFLNVLKEILSVRYNADISLTNFAI
jgi:hypothetical protein